MNTNSWIRGSQPNKHCLGGKKTAVAILSNLCIHFSEWPWADLLRPNPHWYNKPWPLYQRCTNASREPKDSALLPCWNVRVTAAVPAAMGTSQLRIHIQPSQSSPTMDYHHISIDFSALSNWPAAPFPRGIGQSTTGYTQHTATAFSHAKNH